MAPNAGPPSVFKRCKMILEDELFDRSPALKSLMKIVDEKVTPMYIRACLMELCNIVHMLDEANADLCSDTVQHLLGTRAIK